ncbi:MAG: flavin reductase [Chloroflexi bacterium]|nr:MAG: flavin reductase [Chloroflexota bacterium]
MGIDAQAFKEVMAHWATGVTVVTTMLDGAPVGITANSFTSVSLQPPQVLICVNKSLHTNEAIQRSGFFAVNILSAEQQEWGIIFAGMKPEILDRFEGIDWSSAETGAPILPDVLGWLDCRLSHAYDGDDHTIFVGEVAASDARRDGSPLLYYNRGWRRMGSSWGGGE